MFKNYDMSDLESDKVAKHQSALCLDEAAFRAYFPNSPAIPSGQFDCDAGIVAEQNDYQYNPKEYLQAYVKAALDAAKRVDFILQLGSSWKPVLLLPKTNEIWVDAEEHEIKAHASKLIPRAAGIAEMTLLPAKSHHIKINEARYRLQNADSFLWKLSSWASQGRYPKQFDINVPLYLKSWPNFTRFLLTPHALRIATLLVEEPRTMANVAQTLKINLEYVFLFISAAFTLGLVGTARRNADLMFEPLPLEPHESWELFEDIIQKLQQGARSAP